MTTLLEHLERQDPARLAIVTPSEAVTIGALVEHARGARAAGDRAEPRIVSGADPAQFLRDLVAYDGSAATIVLQPEHATVPVPDAARPAAPSGGTRWVMGTSGTTGMPKAVAHTFRSLTATTKMDPAAGSGCRWGLLYDPARFAGLQVVLQALLGGAGVVAPRSPDLDQAVAFMRSHGVTALSATPSHWRKLLMTEGIGALPLRQITLGGEIADAAILNALRARFPASRITHIYAATEVGVGFSVHDGRPGFPRAYLDEPPAKGIALQLGDDGHLWVRRAPDERAAGVPVLDGSAEGFVDTGDLVRIEGDRVLFLGRAGGAINVGGSKVNPEEVEAVLRSHPAVVAARVFGKRSSLLGSIVAAEIQVRQRDRAEEVRRELAELCRARLDRHQRPAAIAVVTDLAIGISGKVERKEA